MERFLDKHFNSLLVIILLLVLIFKGNSLSENVFNSLIPLLTFVVGAFLGVKHKDKSSEKNNVMISKDKITVEDEEGTTEVDRK